MSRQRRPRTSEEMYSKKTDKSQTVFDYEKLKADPNLTPSDAQSQSESTGRLMQRENRKSTKQTYVENKSSSYTIRKARDIPSAIHGTKKPNRTPAELTNQPPRDGGYRSSIVEEIKRERVRKEKKKQAVKERQRLLHNQRLASSPTSAVFLDTEKGKHTKGTEQLSLITPLSPINVSNEQKTSKSDVQKPVQKKQTTSEKKRVGPRFSYPSLYLLGAPQNTNYDLEDPKITERIINAFNHINIPIDILNYVSNGMFGSYKLKVKVNLRIGQLNQLQTLLKPYLEDMHVRITTENLNSGIINLEVPLTKKNIITFSTLFNTSSLKMRKNDFKVAIGKTIEDKMCSFQLTKAGHMLIYGGRVDSTKLIINSILLSLMMNHTPLEVQTHFITEKRRYQQYVDLPYSFDTHKEITDDDAFDSILAELIERQNQFRRVHVRNIQSLNQRLSPHLRKSIIVVVIDDLHTILKEKNKYAYSALQQLLQKGKAYGIHCIVKQSDISYDLRFELLRLMQTRITFLDPQHRIMNGAEGLSQYYADCLIQLPTTSKPTRITLGTVTQSTLKDVITHIKEANLT